ncbi:hypothetical protein OG21DRAFT_1526461 [Imleria badia]|nr:hypothetical protein OG21DRAFT_1526461 [Imleria badia]
MFSCLITLLSIHQSSLCDITAPQGAPNASQATSKGGDAGNISQPECITSSQYCYNQKFSDPTKLSGNIGAVLNTITGVTVPAELTCTPISILGFGNAGDCTNQPACCTKNTGDVVCSPLAVNM